MRNLPQLLKEEKAIREKIDRFEHDVSLIDYVCTFRGITKDELVSRSRKKDFFLGRVLVSYIFLYRKWSLHEIADEVGRGHCSIMHYKYLLLDEWDKMIENEVRLFVLWMWCEGVDLPTLEEFRDKVTIKQK